MPPKAQKAQKAQKTGMPFLILLVLVTVALSYWFLQQKDAVVKEIGNTTMLDTNQSQVVNNSNSAIEENAVPAVPIETAFQKSAYQFRVKVTEDESIREVPSGDIYTVYFDEDKLSVMDAADEETIRASVSINSETTVEINNVTGSRIKASSTKDGSEVNLILVVNNGRLYNFQGSDSFLDRMIQDFTFTN